MTVLLPEEASTSVTRLRAVLCGSYHVDQVGLATALDELRTVAEVLSPSALDFVDPGASVVRLPHETDDEAGEIEQRHLAAIRAADFVWLHAPDGYVGVSAALEVGHAAAYGVPVFTSADLADDSLRSFTLHARDPRQATERISASPGTGLVGLQAYYERIARRRGWAEETPRDTLLLLTEELGELARAVRKMEGLRRDGLFSDRAVGEELADVVLYVVHLANSLGIDLSDAVTHKELLNAQRFVEAQAA